MGTAENKTSFSCLDFPPTLLWENLDTQRHCNSAPDISHSVDTLAMANDSVQHLKQDKISYEKKIIWETRISQHKHYNTMQRTVREELVCTLCQRGASEVPVRMSRRKLNLWTGAAVVALIVLVRDLFGENPPIKDQTVNLQHKHHFSFSTQVIKLKID